MKDQYQHSKDFTYAVTAVGPFVVGGLGRQHRDLGSGLLDELLQVNLPQFFGQLLQLVLHVLQRDNGSSGNSTRVQCVAV